jgi:hypothetical protein
MNASLHVLDGSVRDFAFDFTELDSSHHESTVRSCMDERMALRLSHHQENESTSASLGGNG